MRKSERCSLILNETYKRKVHKECSNKCVITTKKTRKKRTFLDIPRHHKAHNLLLTKAVKDVPPRPSHEVLMLWSHTYEMRFGGLTTFSSPFDLMEALYVW